MTGEMCERYSRQMLVYGKDPQERLSKLRVLVVGAGALGCGCLPYLVGAGVGYTTICDGDIVEISNLHRQTLYTEIEAREKKNKAEAAASRLRACNSQVKIHYIAKHCGFNEETMDIIKDHDIICDCTDNIGTRYLLNDACYLLKKILVSAAAIGREGSLAIYNFTKSTSCLRCAQPRPAMTEGRRRCADAGVLGPVPGILGGLQALAVIDLCAAQNVSNDTTIRLFDGATLRSFKRPSRRPSCLLCGDDPTIRTITDAKQNCDRELGICVSENDSVCFGGLRLSPQSPLPSDAEISCSEIAIMLNEFPASTLLVDVRDARQFSMCAIPQAHSFPLREILLKGPQVSAQDIFKLADPSIKAFSIFFICRRGIDSVTATRYFLHQDHAQFLPPSLLAVKNVTGGLEAWRSQVDSEFPSY